MPSATFIAAMQARETDAVLIDLLTITAGASTIRLANNTEDVTSNGETFVGFPFQIERMSEQEGTPPRARVRVQNVDRRLGDLVRALTVSPTARIDQALASDPSTLETSWQGFRLRDLTVDAIAVIGTLTGPELDREPYPVTRGTSDRTPALWYR